MHQHFTRQVSKGNIFMERVNTTQYGKRSVRYAGAMLWNTLPVCIKGVFIQSCFKKEFAEVVSRVISSTFIIIYLFYLFVIYFVSILKR